MKKLEPIIKDDKTKFLDKCDEYFIQHFTNDQKIEFFQMIDFWFEVKNESITN